MAEHVDMLAEIGQNRLEQVYINMPEVYYYFSGDREQTGENLTAYLGKDQLELKHLQTFSETNGGVYYYVLLDVSASISKGEFSGITGAISEFCKNVEPEDHVVCLTFGEDVETLFDFDGQELAGGAASESLAALTNPDQRTLLFEAINQMSELSAGVPASESMRRVAFVITDGEDIATGKATRDEALKTLQESGIPVYGFVAENTSRSSINAFGEFSRATGGYLTIVDQGAESESFEDVRQEIMDSYVAVYEADSNLIDNAKVNAVLKFGAENESKQMEVLKNRWIPDTVMPEIAEVTVEGIRQLRVEFSENVSGADAADNFRLESGDESLIPAFASVGTDGKSVVLSFAEDIPAGEYQLVCSNIYDASMEKNSLEDEFSVSIAARETETTVAVAETEPALEEESNPLKDYGLILLLVIAAAVAAVVVWMKKKKSGADNSRTSGTGAVSGPDDKESTLVVKKHKETHHHVSIETQKLEEKQVYFHVIGQKEEIPFKIQKSMIVGRSSICELFFDDPALSRQHFAIELQKGNVLIQNLSQGGATMVNGIRLDSQPRTLRSGDEISAGQIKMRIRW